MTIARARNLPPIVLTSYEAQVIGDLIGDRLATMDVIDREDARTHAAILEARRKIEEARGRNG